MANVVNLNRVRKKNKAAESKKTAEQNRAKFGRTKAEKQRDAQERAERDRLLDGCRRDDKN